MFDSKKLVMLAGAILLSAQVVRADVVYRETFSNTAGAANTNFNFVGWEGYWSPTAQTTDQGNTTGLYNNFGIGSSLGRPSGLDNVNAGANVGNTNGFAFSSGFLSVSNNILTYTSEYTVNPAVWSVGSISFYSGNTSNNPNAYVNNIPTWRIAVQIDGNWYVSSTQLVQTINIANAAGFASSGQQLVFNWTTAASAWLNLDFVPGTTLAVGGPVGSDLPNDPITAFGLYSDPSVNTNGLWNATATRRWDTFQIDGTAIPEPSTVALVFISLGALLGLARSRKA